jgi:hypothetical protein
MREEMGSGVPLFNPPGPDGPSSFNHGIEHSDPSHIALRFGMLVRFRYGSSDRGRLTVRMPH